MKRLILLFALLTAQMCYSQSPINITNTNFGFNNEPDSVYYMGSGTYSYPTEGENQLWDYSGLISGGIYRSTYSPVEDVFFPDAVYQIDNGFITIGANRGAYMNEIMYFDEDGFYSKGYYVEEQNYSIADLTGDPQDSFWFPEQDYVYENNHYYTKFPLNYGSVCTSQFTMELNFIFTVTSFYLNEIPGIKRSHITQIDTVVGWGNLILPTKDNQQTAPIPVLLVKRHFIQIDSMLMAGMPAPAALLSAFGITQGAITHNTYYNFLRENSKVFALRIAFANNNFQTPTNIYWDKKADYLISSVDENPTNPSSVYAFPNPNHGEFTMKLSNTTKKQISVKNTLGQEVYRMTIENEQENVNIKLPEGTVPGVYIYSIDNKLSGKIVVL